MKIAIVIPAHNEAAFIKDCLLSLCKQSYLPSEIIVVNDHSSDETPQVVESIASSYPFVKLVHHASSPQHLPGGKIIQAFYEGYRQLSGPYDVICKFDADLIFPSNYLMTLQQTYNTDARLGMFAGFCYIQNSEGRWVKENLTNDDHIRGPIKSYRNACFQDIGGLKKEMGWDSVDEMLARYHQWKTKTDPTLHVKHLKPTGERYSSSLASRYGEALYKMDNGFVLSALGLLKLAWLKKRSSFFWIALLAYVKAAWIIKPTPIVTQKEGKFIRNYRWQMIFRKFSSR